LPGSSNNNSLQIALSHGNVDNLYFRSSLSDSGWNSWKKLVTSSDKLPTPYALTFTGAITGTWDGSAAKTINIPASASGPKGDKGDPGENGITPTIGSNGNWYLGDTDTGKPSRGATGSKGDTGAQGPKGDPANSKVAIFTTNDLFKTDRSTYVTLNSADVAILKKINNDGDLNEYQFLYYGNP
jgi:hypothetical protein